MNVIVNQWPTNANKIRLISLISTFEQVLGKFRDIYQIQIFFHESSTGNHTIDWLIGAPRGGFFLNSDLRIHLKNWLEFKILQGSEDRL